MAQPPHVVVATYKEPKKIRATKEHVKKISQHYNCGSLKIEHKCRHEVQFEVINEGQVSQKLQNKQPPRTTNTVLPKESIKPFEGKVVINFDTCSKSGRSADGQCIVSMKCLSTMLEMGLKILAYIVEKLKTLLGL